MKAILGRNGTIRAIVDDSFTYNITPDEDLMLFLDEQITSLRAQLQSALAKGTRKEGMEEAINILNALKIPGDTEYRQAYNQGLREGIATIRAAIHPSAEEERCEWVSLGEGWHQAACRQDQEEWAYNEDWKVCPYCGKPIKIKES